ncbi:MAG: HAMP domain-containing protein, partial [Leptolyngbyaceae cyanobacterium SM1_1_3]|nr:HAMP domain-containing protein [Leptolyngbyaceae cyanobacterium SM1_1_3]
KQIQIYPTLSYIGLTLPTGEYIGAGDWLEAPGIEVDQIAADGQAETYAVDSNGNRQKLIDRYEYFPRKEDWYIDILQLGKPNWTVAAEVSQPDEHAPFYVAANANWPIYDSSGKLLALISTDLEISHISQFLASLRPSASSRIFIIQRDGSLVGSCSLPRLSEASDFEKAMQANGRIDVLNLPVSLTQATAQYLHQTFGGFQTIQHSQTLNFNFQGDRQYVQVTPWQDDFGLDWLVVVVVPESDFMAQIHANTRTTILLCIVSAAIASLLGLFTAYWIARPISRLNRAAKAIAAGNLEQQVESSPIQELSSLSQSFNRMATQLTNSFNDLESTNETLEHRVRQRTQDLTQALRDLQQTQIQLVQTEKMSSLGQLVAGVAHEINNPISFIYGNLPHAKGYIHDLLKILQCYQQEYSTPSTSLKNLIEEVELAFLQEDLPKLLSSMQVGAERIQGIVQSLRTFSRLDESGFKPVDIHEGIDSTLMILQSRLKATSKRPAIKVIKEYDTLPLVSCYPGQLNQVFMNILANATDALDELEKHCPAVDASMYKIRICTKKAEPNGVIIRIANWGKKIPEEVYSQLFDPFSQQNRLVKELG